MSGLCLISDTTLSNQAYLKTLYATKKLSGKDFKDGLVVIDYDTSALKSMEYLDYNQNVEYYIEYLTPGTGLKEMLSDYCKLDIPSKVQNRPEMLSIVEKVIEQENKGDKRGAFDTQKDEKENEGEHAERKKSVI